MNFERGEIYFYKDRTIRYNSRVSFLTYSFYDVKQKKELVLKGRELEQVFHSKLDALLRGLDEV
jgi:hypothetical protein